MMSATSIPVSCDGVKTHVFMDDSIALRGGGGHCASQASRSESLQIKKPVCCGYAAAFHFRAALPGMLSPTLIRDEVLEMGQPCEKRLLTTTRVMKPFHGEQLPLYGVVRLV